MLSLILKFSAPLLLVAFGVIAGIGVQQKILNRSIEIPEPRPCPSCSCNCPDAVTIQPFDVEKIKNLKSFQYSPQFTGNVSVSGVDSTKIRVWMEQSVMKAFDKHVIATSTKKRK